MSQVAKSDTYPIPKIKDLFAHLSEGQSFTTLDLDRAYQHLKLESTSQQYVVINTHRGLYHYNGLPFGVTSAPGIFQRTMENLQEIPGVVDDILITEKTTREHLHNLERVLGKLQEAGLRLNKSKCRFMQKRIKYLEHVIDASGLHSDKERIKAIKKAPRPQNVSELKSYLGLLSYYGKFLCNVSTVLAPLHRLLRKEVNGLRQRLKRRHLRPGRFQKLRGIIHRQTEKD